MEFCRLCYLETPLELCKNVFVREKDDPPVLELIAKLADLQINRNDPYPKNICPICYVRLIGFHEFRQVILNADSKFRCIYNNKLARNNIKYKKTLQTGSGSSNNDEVIDLCSDNEIVTEVSPDIVQDNGSDNSNDYTEPIKCEIEILENIDIEQRPITLSTTETNEPKVRKTLTEMCKNQVPTVCYICGKVYKDGNQFDVHLRVHTGEKPYQCTICNKRYTTSGSLKSHRRLHTGERPYKCKYCNRTFSQYSGWHYHLKIHTDAGPYNCNLCNKTFQRRFCLGKHMKVHAGERPFKCDICQQLFTRKIHLNAHLTLHGDEKPYQCKYCNRRYTHIAYVTRHQMKCSKRPK